MLEKSSASVALGAVLAPVSVALKIIVGRELYDGPPRASNEVWRSLHEVDICIGCYDGLNVGAQQQDRVENEMRLSAGFFLFLLYAPYKDMDLACSLVRKQEYYDFFSDGMLSSTLQDCLLRMEMVMQFGYEDDLVPLDGYRPWACAFEDGNGLVGLTFCDVCDCWRCDRLSRSTPCADQEFFSPAMLQVPITVHFDHGSWREELMEVLELAQEFIDETGIDAQAVCIGNVHGEYPASGPKLRLDLLKEQGGIG
ncbi:hypothetical protein L1887_30703 [Cichorium endivia]|nr:hypothetical protein L1887_30703 [Cichorium endivia]